MLYTIKPVKHKQYMVTTLYMVVVFEGRRYSGSRLTRAVKSSIFSNQVRWVAKEWDSLARSALSGEDIPRCRLLPMGRGI